MDCLLHEGDRLNSDEFIWRWEAMPGLRQAELINGVVFCMPSLVGLSHASIHGAVAMWAGVYADETPGIDGGTDATWKMGESDVPQPDVHLRILPESGGQSSEGSGYGLGAPELVIEVTGSTLSRDLGIKLDLYRRTGVREYLTVLLNPQRVIWRELVRGRYREIEPSEDGLLKSRIFPGLWLDPASLWNRRRSIRTALQRGLRSPEHAAFVLTLSARAKRRKQRT